MFATKTTLWIVYFDLALIFFRESLRDAVSFLLKLIEQCECVVYTNLGKYDLKNTITILEICDRHRPFKAYSLKNKYLWVSGWGYDLKTKNMHICALIHNSWSPKKRIWSFVFKKFAELKFYNKWNRNFCIYNYITYKILIYIESNKTFSI